MKNENPHSDGVATGAEAVDSVVQENIDTAKSAQPQPISIESSAPHRNKGTDKGSRPGPSQSKVLVDLVQTTEQLFHTSEGACFADLRFDGHRETLRRGAPNSEALKSALGATRCKPAFQPRKVTP